MLKCLNKTNLQKGGAAEYTQEPLPSDLHYLHFYLYLASFPLTPAVQRLDGSRK